MLLIAFNFVVLLCLLSVDSSHSSETYTKFANKTVYSGIILTDIVISTHLGRDFHKVPQGVNGTQSHNAQLRHENARATVKQLPFAVDEWTSIYAPPCPNRKNKGNDRGVAMSHYQIWADFVYSGLHHAPPNGAVVSDDDLLVIFEDDAVIAVKDIRKSLYEELSSISTDILFLGWCYGRRQNMMPMCGHAYVLTRSGAKKLLQYFDICSSGALDGQWHHIHRQYGLTWSKAKESSYSDVLSGYEDKPGYFTRGIFIQRNGLVSFNHHGFQNNAN